MTSDRSSVSVLSAASTAIWLIWAGAGLAGLRSGGDEPPRLRQPATPVTVERMNVEMLKTAAQRIPTVAAAHRDPLTIPQVPPAISLPALAPVADPKLEVPFPVLVKRPLKVIHAKSAAPVLSGPAVEHLTLGEGEGDQPKPEYPREARLAHEEGSVVVEMTIDESGEVTDAVISSASPWPILNQAALRAVRDTWRFSKGPVRRKDIRFVFQLRER